MRFQAEVREVLVDGKPLVDAVPATASGRKQVGHVHLEQGKKVALKVRYSADQSGSDTAQLIWSKYDPKPSSEAIAAAKNADVVVAVLGITSELEGEEMPVSEEGFKGGDRTSIDLPKPEEELLEAVAATGKPVVLVLANGSALAVNWAKNTSMRFSNPGMRARKAARLSRRHFRARTIPPGAFQSRFIPASTAAAL